MLVLRLDYFFASSELARSLSFSCACVFYLVTYIRTHGLYVLLLTLYVAKWGRMTCMPLRHELNVGKWFLSASHASIHVFVLVLMDSSFPVCSILVWDDGKFTERKRIARQVVSCASVVLTPLSHEWLHNHWVEVLACSFIITNTICKLPSVLLDTLVFIFVNI